MLYEFFRAVLAIKLCLVIYSHLKQEIPVLNPGLYDEALWRIDRWARIWASRRCTFPFELSQRPGAPFS